jgi:hypothetical protein
MTFAAGLASAQPMMIDPSKMSGIPRPDPQVPAGTITVRVIRGDLSNRVFNHPVELLDAAGKVVKTENTDAEAGRATFGGLSGGPFVARVKDGSEVLTSQPIELQPNAGTRVMLVFKPPAGAEKPPESGEAPPQAPTMPAQMPAVVARPDGSGKPDKSVPPGTVIVRAVGGDGQPLAGLVVKLGQVRAGESAVVERKAQTNDKGEARFEGLDAKPTSGYLAEVEKAGAKFAGKPFRMPENLGVRVEIEVNPTTKDLSSLSIAQGSHFIFQVSDDAVQVIEVLRLYNRGSEAVTVDGGLHFPLPDAALQATPGQQAPPSFSVAGHDAVLRGPIPPGDTELQIQFVLTFKTDRLEFVQKTPLPYAETAIVTEKIDGFSVEGDKLDNEERELQGRKLELYRGPGTSAGGEIKLDLVGLPHADASWRYAAAVVTVLLLLGFGLYAAAGDGGVSEKRRSLETRREQLLDELVALEKKPEDKKRNQKRDDVKEKLAQLYRDLDQIT